MYIRIQENFQTLQSFRDKISAVILDKKPLLAIDVNVEHFWDRKAAQIVFMKAASTYKYFTMFLDTVQDWL